MRRNLVAWGVLAVAPLAVPVFATTATSMGSFEGEEEPTVVYDVQSGFHGDSYDNMTNPSSGVFRFTLRYRRGDWWDGDRSTTNTDRQRAEVKGLGSHQRPGETFDYGHTWKTPRMGDGKFWHVFQLKAIDGDNGAPLVVDGINSSSAAVRYWSGSATGFSTARSYSISTGSFVTTVVRIKVATSGGACQASINGGSFSGKTNIGMYRPGATSYRPKWGSYRGVDASRAYGDDTIEQKNVTANKR